MDSEPRHPAGAACRLGLNGRIGFRYPILPTLLPDIVAQESSGVKIVETKYFCGNKKTCCHDDRCPNNIRGESRQLPRKEQHSSCRQPSPGNGLKARFGS